VLSRWLQGVLMAFVVFVLLSSIKYQSNQPNSELLLNCILAAFFLLITKPGEIGKTDLIFYGLLSLSATMIKQHTLIPILCLGITPFILRGETDNPLRKWLLPSALAATLVGWVALLLYYQGIGHLRDLWIALVAMPASYNLDHHSTIIKAFAFENLSFLIGSLIGTFGSLFFGNKEESQKSRLVSVAAILLAIGCYVMTALPGRWYPHYYQLMTVPILISLTLLISSAEKKLPRKVAIMALALLSFLVVWGAFVTIRDFRALSAQQISMKKYGPWFIETEQVSPMISRLLKGDEWFYMYGQDAGLYVYTDKWPKTRFVDYSPFIFAKIQSLVYPIFLEEVRKSPPDLIVFPRSNYAMIAPNQNDPIVHWAISNYFPIASGPAIHDFLFLARIGSALDKRTPETFSRRPFIEYLK